MNPATIRIDPLNPDTGSVEKACAILKEGGVIVFPTETFYGLGADIENEKAIDKIYRIKGRDYAKPIPIIIGNLGSATDFTVSIPASGNILIDRFWPGPLTIVAFASHKVPTKLSAGTGKIGIRYSSNLIAASLALSLHGAITATSANLSGEKECSSFEEARDVLGNRVDAFIDGGKTPGKGGSTIVDVTIDPPVILREGIITKDIIQQALGNVKKGLLF